MPERRARFHFDNTFVDERRPVGAFILWQVGDLCCEPGYTVAAHRQAVHELTLAVSGMGENLAGGTAYPMTPGTLIFNPRGDLHEITAARAQTLRYFYLGFDFPDTPSPSPEIGALRTFFETCGPCAAADAGALGDTFVRLFGEVNASDAAGKLLCESAMQEILCLACRLLGKSGAHPYRASDARAVDEKLVCDLMHYLDAHPAESGTLSRLTQEFGYSYTHLAQKFAEITGENLRAYQSRARFRRAREYLRRGETVTRTAELCGYQSIHAFSRAFRRAEGVSPSEFRRKNSA